MRRLNQPSSYPIRAKEFVDCLLCELPSDSEDEERHATLTRRQARDGIRLDKLMSHFKAKHKAHRPTEGRSLLDMGFTVSVAREVDSLPLDEDKKLRSSL